MQSDEWKGENNPIREGRREGAEEVSENIFLKITIRSAKRFFFFFIGEVKKTINAECVY